MSQIQITNTSGQVVSTIQTGQVDTTTSPISLVGQGVAPYSQYIGDDLYRMLENFANDVPPANPVLGQLWFDTTLDHPDLSIWCVGQWVPIGLGITSSMVAIKRLSTANSINFTVVQQVPLVTIDDTAFNYHVTAIALVPPLGAINTATSPPTFDLFTSVPGDVMADTVVTSFAGNRHAFYIIQGTSTYLSNGNTLYLNITTPAAGGSLTYTAYPFAFRTLTIV